MKKNLTLRYTVQQCAYWAAAAGVVSFATAFLLEKGFVDAIVHRKDQKSYLTTILKLHQNHCEGKGAM